MKAIALLLAGWLAAGSSLAAQPAAPAPADSAALARSIDELRRSIGRWEVVTEFLNPDGSAARTVNGSYEFAWVVQDRVVSGRSEIPELRQAAGILFYVDEGDRAIEMVSVGADGQLWVMTGPLGGTARFSQEYEPRPGVRRQLRFTTFNVGADAFESRMDYSDDGGATWTPGNHQRFRRVAPA